MYPKVKPALARAWRDLNTVQFGVTPARAVVLGPVDPATAHFLGLVDGTRSMELLRAEATAMGLSDGHADRVVRRLAEAGLIDDGTVGGPAARAVRERTGLVERLGPDLGSLSLVRPEPGGPLRGLAARAALRVQVRGGGRVGALIASVLAAAGVGRVEAMDGGLVEPADVVPGGLPAEAVGRRRAEALPERVAAAAPGPPPRASGTGPPEPEPGLALVVVAPRDGLAAFAPDPDGAEGWVAAGIPHLYAGVLETTGLVGPLVLPGASGCAGCMERERVDEDGAWPRMLTQWRAVHRRGAPACDLALATAVAGVAAAHALAFLDGEVPDSAGARWEATLPQLGWRRRPVPAHPLCPCGAAGSGEGVRTAGAREPQDTMTA
ncbi:ThiF family adenylyltransferase [Streptomyces bambusae]|uniref:ThiF family adenylyltransferase n=1 Tax=Streptomyces bambusae TaxID=1550616 RepID=UPI001CFF7D00|nr:ThiF family adenylyltransferase [Streptomyces bambusae]MCB5169323.1 ThiF family adenylyltransferase [Streptomyces bambusae]